VLETSQAPVFASHSSCRALASHRRNMTDEMIVAMAKKGGVIQINFACEFLSEESARAAKKLWPEYDRLLAAARDRFKDDSEGLKREVARLDADSLRRTPPATLADVVAHIDHAVKLAGIDAVGIGSDFDGITCAPKGLEDVSKFPDLTRALLEKGYSAEDIRKISGGNTLRLMRAVERAAK
jgi:membrane dipeptidase